MSSLTGNSPFGSSGNACNYGGGYCVLSSGSTSEDGPIGMLELKNTAVPFDAVFGSTNGQVNDNAIAPWEAIGIGRAATTLIGAGIKAASVPLFSKVASTIGGGAAENVGIAVARTLGAAGEELLASLDEKQRFDL